MLNVNSLKSNSNSREVGTKRSHSFQSPFLQLGGLRFLDRLLSNAVPPVFGSHWVYLVHRSTPWQQERAILCYTPAISFLPRHANSHRVPDHISRSKGEAYSSISSSRRSVRFYEASKHSSLALINQEVCRHSLRLPLISYTLFAFSPTLHTSSFSS